MLGATMSYAVDMGKRLTEEERGWRQLSEKQFQDQVLALARIQGWRCFHANDSRKMVRRGNSYIPVGDNDAKGFPDCCMVHPLRGIVFLELKKELGKTTPEQDEWLAALQQAGVEARVVRPSDWDWIVTLLAGR